MKIVVKTLKGNRFEIQVNSNDSVADVKRNIETLVGASEYPAAEQMLIHKGKVLQDETTMEANNVADKSSIAIMKRKSASTTGLSTVSVCHYSQAKVAPVSSTQPSITRAIPPSVSTRATDSPPLFELKLLPPGVPTSVSPSYMVEKTTSSETERSIQQILEICGGNWTRDTVAYALHAAYYNPDRAVEYLYSGIPVLIANPSNPNAPVYYLPEVVHLLSVNLLPEVIHLPEVVHLLSVKFFSLLVGYIYFFLWRIKCLVLVYFCLCFTQYLG